jgi:hypothetical protein
LLFNATQGTLDIDSVILRTTRGRAALAKPRIPTTSAITIARSVDFTPAMEIRREGDSLKIETYERAGKSEDCLVFGDQPGSIAASILPGHSLTRVTQYSFSRDKSPTIGAGNDTAGVWATLRGTVYDATGRPVAGTEFIFDDPFVTNAQGRFVTRVFAQTREWKSTFYRFGVGFRSCSIRPIRYDLHPDSAAEVDIHLLGQLSSFGEPVPAYPEALISFFPEPAAIGAAVHYQTTLPVAAMRTELSICDVQGRILMNWQLTRPEGAFLLPESIRSGVYYAIVHSGSRAHGITRLSVLR